MRQRLVAVLKGDDKDVFSEGVLRRFWAFSRPPRTAARGGRAGGRVVDLAKWLCRRGEAVRA